MEYEIVEMNDLILYGTKIKFCSHIANKKYCIANMQFEEEEYFEIKKNNYKLDIIRLIIVFILLY